MTLREMREKIDAFLSLGKHWRTEMREWSAITQDTKLAPREGKTGLRLRLYTDRHVYSVAMYEAAEGKPSYLGCVMSNRAPWPGETHTRGGDLADGEFNDETLRKIAADILSKELHVLVAPPAGKPVEA
ncbi:MAG TPA: hypothetical protein VM389_15245 [Phycisphaerae bacterium]|nr:hypothetical protein [Phycisphaerae bacterium]